MDENHPTPRNYTSTGRAAYKKKKRRQKTIRRWVTVGVLVIVLVLLFTQCIGPNFLWKNEANAKTTSSGEVASMETTENLSSTELSSTEEISSLLTSTGIVGSTAADWKLLLVNQSHVLDSNYIPDIAYIPEGYIINATANRFDSRAIDSLTGMIEAAEKDGITLRVTSAYRDLAYQKNLFNNKVNEIKTAQGLDQATAEVEASKYVAIPGTSEHSTGLAVDIVSADYFTKNKELNENFENTEEFKWLDAHASEYGFILRFPKGKEEITKISYEPWHYRYVGVENAASIKKQNITLEEYLNQVE